MTHMFHLIVALIPEILRDSNQFLFELEDAATLDIYVGDEVNLVTGDIESLYANILPASSASLCCANCRSLPLCST